MKWIKRQFRTFSAGYRWWRSNVTMGGKVISIFLVVTFSEVTNFNSPLFILWAAFFSLFTVAIVTSRFYRPNVRIIAPVQLVTRSGDQAQLTIELHNLGQRALFDLAIEFARGSDLYDVPEQQEMVSVLEKGESRSVSTTLQILRRGVSSLPEVQLRTSFPLGLIRLGRRYKLSGEIVACPTFERRQGLPWPTTSGNHREQNYDGAQRIGHGFEYCGNREYQPGVPVRRWDYSSWARLGRPVVRDYYESQNSSVGIVVQSSVFESGKLHLAGEHEFEQLVSETAAFVEVTLRERIAIDWIVFDGRVFDLRTVQLESRQSYVMRALAAIERKRDNESAGDLWLMLAQGDLLKSATALVLLLGFRPDAEMEQMRIAFESRGCEVIAPTLRRDADELQGRRVVRKSNERSRARTNRELS